MRSCLSGGQPPARFEYVTVDVWFRNEHAGRNTASGIARFAGRMDHRHLQ
jgi:hypothetical protein